MVKDLTLTPSELEAKRYMINTIQNASSKPCDSGNGSDISATIPDWYNEEKFKRGQKYFFDNRCGMLLSNMCGLVTLLADPKGLDVLDSTKRSSTPETARKRYVSTIMHMLSWYEVDLRPDSKSWVSLNRVRKMHLNASNSAGKNDIGIITQTEIALTTFGFMGFALVRPQYLGIRSDNNEDREGFIHFWAVMGHMLGVEDKYNMCLFDIETVENICLIMLRYIFIPLIQLETQKFKQMMDALLKGLSPFLPHMTYDLQMFTVKRIIGVPGYQYGVDVSKEKMCRNIFDSEELHAVQEAFRSLQKGNKVSLKCDGIFFGDGIPIMVPKIHVDGSIQKVEYGTFNIHQDSKLLSIENKSYVEIGDKKCYWIMRSNDNTEWQDYLNDSQYYALSKIDQLIVRWRCFMLKFYVNFIGRYFCEMGLTVVLYIMRRYYNSNIARKTG